MLQKHLISGDVIALHKYQAIYFAIPKVANSSMKAVCADLIRDDLDDRFVAEFWNDRWKPRIFREPKARRFLKKKTILLSSERLAKYDRYWKFCLVRNPWDRMVSCWKQKIGNANASSLSNLNGVAGFLADNASFQADMSFQCFVHAVAAIPDEDANRHFRSQYTFVCDADGNLVVDYVGRLETIDSDLTHIFRTVGIPEQAVPHLLKTNGKPYTEYYNQETRDLVAERFARDIRMFNYSFD